jgi:DNA-directed RNA polymerase specialized sigma subunit
MLKASEHKRMEPRSDIRIGIEGDPDITEALNAIFALNAALKSRWAERQREVVSVYLDDGGTQSQIAAQLGVHQSTVQKALAQANFYAYLKALRTVSGILSQIGRETNV